MLYNTDGLHKCFAHSFTWYCDDSLLIAVVMVCKKTCRRGNVHVAYYHAVNRAIPLYLAWLGNMV